MKILACTISILAAIAASSLAVAQEYPYKPIRMIVPFTTATGPDLVARIVADEMSRAFSQPIVVENRVGAGGRIGAELVSRAAADGYTILLGTASTHLTSPNLVKDMPYDPFKDFAPISMAVTPVVGVVIPTSLPVRSVAQLVEYARENPGRVAYGSTGTGSSSHLVGELLKMTAGVDMLHVPYKGASEVLAAILSGQIQLSFTTVGPARQYINSGKLRMLAVLTAQRYPGSPDVPTLVEALPGYEPVTDWFGFFGPAHLSRPIVTRLQVEMVKALNLPQSRAKLDGLGYVVIASTPEEFASLMEKAFQIYAKVIRAANIPLQ